MPLRLAADGFLTAYSERKAHIVLKLVHRLAFAFYTAILFLTLVPTALAASVHPATALAVNSKQTWVLLIGALVPLGTYVLNHVGPWVSEPAKAFVTVLVSAVAGGLYTALATTSFGWNTASLEMVISSVAATLAAHHMLWKPSAVAALLGGGSNAGKQHRHLGWVANSPPDAGPDA